MKINKLSIILIIIIILLVAFICYDKFIYKEDTKDNESESTIVTDYINLDYVSIILTNEGYSYLMPITELNTLDVDATLKNNLETLAKRAFMYDIYVNGSKLKGFRIKLSKGITKIRKLENDNGTYIIFIKEDNTIGLFNVDDYYNNLKTSAIDNYNGYENVVDIQDNLVVYKNGRQEEFKLEK